MRHPAAILIMAIPLAGCGHDVYQRADTSQAQYIQDENDCFASAEQQPPAAKGYVQGGYSLNVEKKRNEIRSCMEARGYTLEPKWPFGAYGLSPTTGPDPAKQPLETRQ
jgi:hypothetical protein